MSVIQVRQRIESLPVYKTYLVEDFRQILLKSRKAIVLRRSLHDDILDYLNSMEGHHIPSFRLQLSPGSYAELYKVFKSFPLDRNLFRRGDRKLKEDLIDMLDHFFMVTEANLIELSAGDITSTHQHLEVTEPVAMLSSYNGSCCSLQVNEKETLELAPFEVALCKASRISPTLKPNCKHGFSFLIRKIN